MKRMVEVKNVEAHKPGSLGTVLVAVGDVRVRVDLTAIAKHCGPDAVVARGHRREWLGGAVVVEAFNVREVTPGGES